MDRLRSTLRTTAARGTAAIGCKAIFGLLLALSTMPSWSHAPQHGVASTLASSAAAIVFGGMVASAVAGARRTAHAAGFGLLFGAAAFGCIFGVGWGARIPIVASLLLAAFGGEMAKAVFKRRSGSEAGSVA